MVEIPHFEAPLTPNPTPQPTINPQAAAEPFNALAQGAERVADVGEVFQQRYAEAKRAAQASDLTANAYNQIDQLEHKWSLVPDRDQAQAGFTKDAAALKSQMVDNIQDPLVKAHVDEQFDARQTTGYEHTGLLAFQRESSARDATLDEHMNGYAHQMAGAVSDFERAQVRDAAKGEIAGTVAGGYIAADRGEQHWINFQQRADAAQARMDMNQDPAAAAAKLSDPKNYPMLDENKRQMLLYSAQSRADGLQAAQRGQVRQAYEDNLAAIERTGSPAVPLSETQIRSAYPDQADAMLAQIKRAGDLNLATSKLAFTTPAQDQALLQQWEPAGAGYRDQLAAYNELAGAIDQKYAATREPVRQAFEDNLSAIAATGKPATALGEDQIRAAFPTLADRMLGEIAAAKQRYAAVGQVGVTPPAQDLKLLEDLQPGGAGYREQSATQQVVAQAIDRKNAALTKDAAAYVLEKSPEISAMFDAANKDPKQLPQAIAALDGAYDKLDMPSWNRPVLPTAQAGAWVNQILKAAPANRADQLTGMAQQFGTAWPRILGDMVHAGLPAPYEIMAAIPSSSARIALADAIGDGKKDVRAAIVPDDAKAIDAGIADSSAMRSLQQSFAYASGGMAKFTEIQNAVQLIAYRFAGSMDPEQAARQAIASVTTDKYDFMGRARVPRGEIPLAEKYGGHLLAALKPSDLELQSTSGPPLTDDQIRDVQLRSVQRGYWLTNEHDDGLVRYDDAKRPVMLANGKRLEFSFAQARQFGKAPSVSMPMPPASSQ